jgi:hypothetical protein
MDRYICSKKIDKIKIFIALYNNSQSMRTTIVRRLLYAPQLSENQPYAKINLRTFMVARSTMGTTAGMGWMFIFF